MIRAVVALAALAVASPVAAADFADARQAVSLLWIDTRDLGVAHSLVF